MLIRLVPVFRFGLCCFIFAMLTACQNGDDAKAPKNTIPLSVQTTEDNPVTFRVLNNAEEMAAVVDFQRPVNGELTDEGDGLFTYHPNRNFTGNDALVYATADRVQHIAIAVTPQNDAPFALPDVVLTQQDEAVRVAPLSNDFDVEQDPLAITQMDTPSSGSMDVAGDYYLFTPAPGFSGSTEVQYTVSDGENSTQGVIYIFVLGPQRIVADFRIETDQTSIAVGDDVVFRAVAELSDGTVLDLTDSVTWNSLDSGVLVFRDLSALGGAFANAVGSTVIRANYGNYSAQFPITVSGRVPAKPAGLTAIADAAAVQLNWSTVSGADRYNLYVNTGETGALVIPNIVPPYRHEPLPADSRYQYRVRAINTYGEGPPSEWAIATTPPNPDVVVDASIDSQPGRIQLSWTQQEGMQYQLYWADTPFLAGGETAEGVTLEEDVSSPFIHDNNLVHDRTYYYLLKAVNDQGGRVATAIRSAVFQAPPPPTPVINSIDTDDRRLVIHFTPEAGYFYHLRWLQADEYDAARSRQFNRITSPFEHPFLTNGLTYQYVLVAEDRYGQQSVSVPVSSSPVGPVSTAAANSVVTGIDPDLESVAAGTTITLTLQAYDSEGNVRTVGGDNAFMAVTGANSGASVNVESNGDGTYALSYTPTVAGQDNYAITLNGDPIGGGPYSQDIEAGAAVPSRTSYTIPPGDYIQGSTIMLTADVFDQFNNPASANVVFIANGANSGDYNANRVGPGRYEAPFRPNSTGQDTLTLSVDGVPVAGVSEIRTTLPAVTVTAYAGQYQQVTRGSQVVLNATGSSGEQLSYTWRQIAGTPVQLNNSNSVRADFTAPDNFDELRFEVQVASGFRTDTAQTTVFVNAGINQHPFRPLFRTEGGVDILIVGQTAYLAGGDSGLKIIDISNAPQLRLIGGLDTAGFTNDVAVAGNYTYLADGNALRIVDTSNPANPFEVSNLGLTDAQGVAVVGGYAYVAAGSNGLQIINVSDPSNPRTEATVPTRDAYRVAISGNYAYVADTSNPGLQVIDISDPTNPGTPLGVQVRNYAVDIKIYGNYAYVADDVAGLTIYDISDPANPGGPYNVRLPYWARDVAVSGNRAYVTTQASGVQVVDVTDPTSPSLIAGYDTSNWAMGVDVAGNYVFVADGGAIQVLDMNTAPGQSPPQLPRVSRAYDAELSGNTLIVADYLRGISAFDVTDPLNAMFSWSVNPSPSLYADVELVGNHAFANANGGLHIVNITDTAIPPVTISAGYSQRALTVSANRIYFGESSTFNEIDITDIANPGTPALFNDQRPDDADVSANNLYLLDGSQLSVIDITDPVQTGDPVVVNLGVTGEKLKMDGGNAHVVASDGKFALVDVSDAANPGPVSTVRAAQTISRWNTQDPIAISGGYAFISAGSEGLHLIDISNINRPTWVAGYGTIVNAYGSAVSGNYVFVADYFGGVNVIDIQQQNNFQISSKVTNAAGFSYTVDWQAPDGFTEVDVKCLVDGGSCSVDSVDRIARQATVTWTLPQAAGNYRITIISGNWHYFNSVYDDVSIN